MHTVINVRIRSLQIILLYPLSAIDHMFMMSHMTSSVVYSSLDDGY